MVGRFGGDVIPFLNSITLSKLHTKSKTIDRRLEIHRGPGPLNLRAQMWGILRDYNKVKQLIVAWERFGLWFGFYHLRSVIMQFRCVELCSSGFGRSICLSGDFH
uniref:(northern house mosquito) hypothetical protein n=1 Tax=Culex pipiens TaxID=7175 RepID=A0A8D8A2S5_CULPI